jgi:flagellar basal-body rod modification protein FlgD
MYINPVSPASPVTGGPSPSSAGGVSQTLDRDAFLRLLLAQLQNQDPIEPVKDQAFVAQLAEFSSLERLEDIRGLLETLVGLASGTTSAPQLPTGAPT